MRTSLEVAKLIYKSAVGIEIGIGKGDNACDILSSWEGLNHLFLVDNFSYDGIVSTSHLQKVAEKNLEIFAGRKTFIIASSENGAMLFKDEFLDFAYIDANHKAPFVKKDIEVWYPKIKVGGMLCGHDYDLNEMGVMVAVNDFVTREKLFLYTDYNEFNRTGEKSDWWIFKPRK